MMRNPVIAVVLACVALFVGAFAVADLTRKDDGPAPERKAATEPAPAASPKRLALDRAASLPELRRPTRKRTKEASGPPPVEETQSSPAPEEPAPASAPPASSAPPAPAPAAPAPAAPPAPAPAAPPAPQVTPSAPSTPAPDPPPSGAAPAPDPAPSGGTSAGGGG